MHTFEQPLQQSTRTFPTSAPEISLDCFVVNHSPDPQTLTTTDQFSVPGVSPECILMESHSGKPFDGAFFI